MAHQSVTAIHDLLIVGGGVNGCGIARDAAGRGLSVALCEQHDLAAHTSSASTKLIHGGLRYLEHLELRLVSKALKEREVLIASAPHIMWPLRFVMPHAPHLRPAWLIRLGLLLYDNLARRRYLPASRAVNLREHTYGEALALQFSKGFVYSDGWVDDARLVVLNAKAAAELGATILTRTACTQLQRLPNVWQATLRSSSGEERIMQARAVVNATGPWVAHFLGDVAQLPAQHHVRLVKGSHIVVRRMFSHPYAYIFQAADKRIVFAIPYEQHFTLIGTTDLEYRGDPSAVTIDAAEVDYLCRMVNGYFKRQLSAADVLWSYSGVRPLLDDQASDASSVTRDYKLELQAEGPPLLSVFGGKLTTYRRLAEEAMALLLPALGNSAVPWTATATLPGGDLLQADFARFARGLRRRYPWLAASLRRRYARAYGSRIARLLDGARQMGDLGEEVLPGLHEREIDYLRREEWALSAADMLWRRSKLGLHLPIDSAEALDRWLAQHPPQP